MRPASVPASPTASASLAASLERSVTSSVPAHRVHHEVDPSRWCVTLEDLEVFEEEVRTLWRQGGIPDNPDSPNEGHDDPHIGPTVYQVNEYYIKPRTRGAGGMSWALMRHPEGLECDVFATHSWAEGVFECLAKVRKAWPHGANHLYLCFLSNPQNDLNWLLDEDDIHKLPFTKALNAARYFLVLPNRRASIYSRLWCVYEAHLAVKATAERGLVIRLPSQAAPWATVSLAAPGLVLLALGFLVSVLVLADRVGQLLTPLLWVATAHVVSATLQRVVPWLVQLTRRKWTFRMKMALHWLQLFVIGVGSGLAQCLLWGFGHDGDSWWQFNTAQRTFFVGEGWACVPLTAILALSNVWDIVRQINVLATKREALQLNFETVRNASCMSASDERRIRQAIAGCEDEIDHAIRTLRTVGRYDQAVQENLSLGMNRRRARDGFGPFCVACGVYSWEYWWVTDLSANAHHIIGQQVPFTSSLLALALVYHIGDRAIFAVDTAKWVGLGFVVASILWARLVGWDTRGQSWSTTWLHLFFFWLMICLDIYHYGGFRVAKCWAATPGNRPALRHAGSLDRRHSRWNHFLEVDTEDESSADLLAAMPPAACGCAADSDAEGGPAVAARKSKA